MSKTTTHTLSWFNERLLHPVIRVTCNAGSLHLYTFPCGGTPTYNVSNCFTTKVTLRIMDCPNNSDKNSSTQNQFGNHWGADFAGKTTGRHLITKISHNGWHIRRLCLRWSMSPPLSELGLRAVKGCFLDPSSYPSRLDSIVNRVICASLLMSTVSTVLRSMGSWLRHMSFLFIQSLYIYNSI